jgi:hypothetical protein
VTAPWSVVFEASLATQMVKKFRIFYGTNVPLKEPAAGTYFRTIFNV